MICYFCVAEVVVTVVVDLVSSAPFFITMSVMRQLLCT